MLLEHELLCLSKKRRLWRSRWRFPDPATSAPEISSRRTRYCLFTHKGDYPTLLVVLDPTSLLGRSSSALLLNDLVIQLLDRSTATLIDDRSSMGSRFQSRSAHMADLKGKRICYEDDGAPIQLTEHDDSFVIKEYHMSLIGKILNPKKQNVEKLIQTMPHQWGLEDRITAIDLGNGKFLFNFSSEEDLNSVLRKGPFHYNYCMFVLVRWEPIVHDDYP
ncbi:hypothetical protein YC2023_117396 [Brassica napus]